MKQLLSAEALCKKKLSYEELELVHINKLSSGGASKQEIKNVRSTIRSWLKAFTLKLENEVGDELELLFDKSLAQYVAGQTKFNIRKSTYATRASRIRKLRLSYVQYKKFQPLPERFDERLKRLLENNDYSVYSFARLHCDGVISVSTLQKWISSKCTPRRDTYPKIGKLEISLNVAAGTLISTLPALNTESANSGKTIDFRKRLQASYSKKYKMWTDKVDEEYKEFVDYKSTDILPEGLRRGKTSKWTFNENNETNSATLYKIKLKEFFGFCCLDKNNPDPQMRGAGMKKEDLTIALLTDKSLVEQYVTGFRKERSDGKFNNGHLVFVVFVITLLSKDVGYLFQKLGLAKKLGLKLNAKSWQERCLNARARFVKIKEAIEQARDTGSSTYELGRNPSEPIKDILKQKYPLGITIKMTEDMLADVEKLYSKPITQAKLYRDTLLIAMLQANPLRASMFTNMKLNKNLIRHDDGSWWIKFKRNSFKNRRILKEDYLTKLSYRLWPMIETYLTKFRPVLLETLKSDYVFTLRDFYARKTKTLSISPTGIWRIVFVNSKKYILNSPGFGPHAFRHIVASSVVKNNAASGVYLAAKVLNNDVKTVEKDYSHLKINEMFEPYNEFFEKNWAAVEVSASTENPNAFPNNQKKNET